MFHNQFADWYRLANLTFTAEGLEKRSQGIEQLGVEIKYDSVLDIVRLSRGEYVPPTFLNSVIEAFAQFDLTFPRRDNTVEVQVLAGCVIAYLLKGKPSSKSDVAALASVTSDFFSIRRQTIIPDFLEMAQLYLRAEGDRVRQLADIDSTSSAPQKTISQKEINIAKEAVTQGFSAASVVGVVDTLISEITQGRATISEFLNVLVKANSGLKGNQEILQEESNILWWLLGETSRDLDQHVSALPLPAASIIIAKELSDHTFLQPGPVSAKHLLNKMLSIGRKRLSDTTLHEATNLAPRDWREKWLPSISAVVLDLCPVMLATSNSLSTNGADDWLPIYEKAMGNNAKEKISATDLAFQVYLECTLASIF